MTPTDRPTRLFAESAHVMGPCFSVELVGDPPRTLRYRYDVDQPRLGEEHPPIVIEIEPSEDAWREFRAALDRLDVWSWRPQYEPGESIGGGSSWSFALAWGGAGVESGGWNAYPGPGGDAEPSAVFIGWCRAVRALIGGRPFA